MVTFVSYCSISAAFLAVTIASAFYTSSAAQLIEKNSFEVMTSLIVHILQSKVYVIFCMNAALCLLILFGKCVQLIFFGNLRVSETKVSFIK